MNNQETENPALELKSLAEDCLNYLRYLDELGAPGWPRESIQPGPGASATVGPTRPPRPSENGQTLRAAPEPEALTAPAGCQNCPRLDIARTSRPGPAPLMIIVESSQEGSLLSGQEGQLLVNIIEKGYQMPRARVCLAPAYKCRSNQADSLFCQTVWQVYLEKAQPQAIMIMGLQAGQEALTFQDGSRPWARGAWGNWRQIPALTTHSPADLLDNPALKRETWGDIKKVLAYLASLAQDDKT